MKILRALPESWTPKITTIEEAKDLNTLKLEDLINSLMSHELIKKRNEESHRGRRTLALKAQNSEESTSTSHEEEEISLLTKKFKKFVRRERTSEWIEDEVKLVKSNAKVRNSLFCALAAVEYDRVSSCIIAKEIWDTLTSIYEGTSQVQGTRRNILICELESF